MTSIVPVKVRKEDIMSFSFPKENLRESTVESTQLFALIKKAVLLGNRYKNKIQIIFRDKVGLKIVETTVWHASRNHVVLKGGTTIPFNRIEEVRL